MYIYTHTQTQTIGLKVYNFTKYQVSKGQCLFPVCVTSSEGEREIFPRKYS